jgi:26S proteasome regulatory subunit N3
MAQGGADAAAAKKPVEAAATTTTTTKGPPSVREGLAAALALLERAAKAKDARLVQGRVLRATATLRRRLGPGDLEWLVRAALPSDSPARAGLLEAAAQARAAAPARNNGGGDDHQDDADMADADAAKAPPQRADAAATVTATLSLLTHPGPASAHALPEVEAYAHLLAVTLLLDARAPPLAARQAAERAAERLARLEGPPPGRPTLAPLAARLTFYRAWAAELCGAPGREVRPLLMAAHQTAVLRHDAVGQETALCALLRSYVRDGLHDQAEAFRAKAVRADQPFRSPPQFARYLFYVGQIRAVQLQYGEARELLQQAARRAPGLGVVAPPVAGAVAADAAAAASDAGGGKKGGDKKSKGGGADGGKSTTTAAAKDAKAMASVDLDGAAAAAAATAAALKAAPGAAGFRVAVAKWLILVRLLLGEVPDRAEFSAPGMHAPLKPYFELTNAVRSGDLARFAAAAEQHRAAFAADGAANLVTRLHHSVIRAGLRRIAAAYSRIPLAAVAAKLALPSAEDAEFVAAKAIREGAIDAELDHGGGGGGGFLRAREPADVYATAEPRAALHARVAFCLDVHNEAVRATRFDPSHHKRQLEGAEARRERLAQEQELARALAEDDEDDDGLGDPMDEL